MRKKRHWLTRSQTSSKTFMPRFTTTSTRCSATLPWMGTSRKRRCFCRREQNSCHFLQSIWKRASRDSSLMEVSLTLTLSLLITWRLCWTGGRSILMINQWYVYTFFLLLYFCFLDPSMARASDELPEAEGIHRLPTQDSCLINWLSIGFANKCQNMLSHSIPDISFAWMFLHFIRRRRWEAKRYRVIFFRERMDRNRKLHLLIDGGSRFQSPRPSLSLFPFRFRLSAKHELAADVGQRREECVGRGGDGFFVSGQGGFLPQIPFCFFFAFPFPNQSPLFISPLNTFFFSAPQQWGSFCAWSSSFSLSLVRQTPVVVTLIKRQVITYFFSTATMFREIFQPSVSQSSTVSQWVEDAHRGHVPALLCSIRGKSSRWSFRNNFGEWKLPTLSYRFPFQSRCRSVVYDTVQHICHYFSDEGVDQAVISAKMTYLRVVSKSCLREFFDLPSVHKQEKGFSLPLYPSFTEIRTLQRVYSRREKIV